MKIKNFNSVITELQSHLNDYLEERGIDTSKMFKCINPAHNDRNPSCSTGGSNKNLFHCFSCSCSGDIFKAAHFLENKSLVGKEFILENLLYLAAKYDVEVQSTEWTEEELYEIDTYQAYKLAHDLIIAEHSSEEFKEAINFRKWNTDICKEFGIGSISSYKDFRETLKGYGFSATFLDDIDLNRRELFDEGHLIFTIKDEHGRPVGFSSRNLRYTEDKQNGAKYVNQKTTGIKCNIYKKGSRLYGFDRIIQKRYKKSDPIYVFEGYSDVVTASLYGLSNCIALGGVSFTIDQLQLLKDYGFYNIYLALDSDETGKRRTTELLDSTLGGHKDLKISIVTVPSEKDPDEFIRIHGIEEFKKLAVRSAFEWRLLQFSEDAEPESICQAMIPLIVNESSNIVQEKYAEILANQTGVSLKAIQADVLRLQHSKEAEKERERQNLLEKMMRQLQRTPQDAEYLMNETQNAIYELNRRYNQDDFSEDMCIQFLDTQKTFQENKSGEYMGYVLGPDLIGIQEALCGEWKQDIWITVGGKANTGKCQKYDSLIQMTDGSQKTIQEVVTQRLTNGLTMENNHKIKPCNFTDWIDSGELECFKVKTTSGISTEPSETHPYYTLEGWKQVKELKVGDKIATVARYPEFKIKESPISKSEAMLFGYFLSDGSITENAGFSNIDEELINSFKTLCLEKSSTISFRTDKNCTTYATEKTKHRNEIKDFLRKYDLLGLDSHTKRVPQEVFQSHNRVIAKFLGAFYACDGWIINDEEQPEIGLTLCNYEMLKDIRSLLLRFGIKTNITESTSAYETNGKRFFRYSLCINDSRNIIKFFNNIKIPLSIKQEKLKTITILSQQKILSGRYSYNEYFPKELWPYIEKLALEKRNWSLSELFRISEGEIFIPATTKKGNLRFKIQCVNNPSTRNDNINPSTFKKIAYLLNDEFLISLAEGDIYFDTITKIESIGKHQCYDLTVEDTHNFICNDTIVHNTSLMCKFAYEIAHHQENNAVVIYHTIDDSADQLLPKYVAIAEGSKLLSINQVQDPKFHAHGKNAEEILSKRETGYQSLRDLIKEGRLIIKDANNGSSLAYADRLIRYYKEKYPTRNLVYILDNFHKLQDFAGADERVRFKTLSTQIKGLAVKHHVAIISTVEYTKLPTGTKPSNNNVAESVQMEYDANAIIHLYNDLHEYGDKATHSHIHPACLGEDPKHMPRIEVIFGKNKISGFKGKIWLDFYPDSSDWSYVDTAVAQAEEQEKEESKKKNSFKANDIFAKED
jgi:replicative DNA helicase